MVGEEEEEEEEKEGDRQARWQGRRRNMRTWKRRIWKKKIKNVGSGKRKRRWRQKKE